MTRYAITDCVAEPIGAGLWVITTPPRGVLDVAVLLGDHAWEALTHWDPMALPDPDASAVNGDTELGKGPEL